MRSVIDRMARAGHPPLHTLGAQGAKAAYAAGASVLEVPRAALARVEDIAIPARDGASVPARLYAPTRDALPCLVFFHGGGFTIGNIGTHDTLCRELSRLGEVAVISVDYRLAPEHLFPTAVNDALDALEWVARQAGTLGLRSDALAVAGDSAGGTLAAVCAIHARDAGIPLALQLLIYPGMTGHQDTASYARFASGYVLDRPLVDFFFSQYLRSDADRDDWRFAPLTAPDAPDLEGVAPAWIGLAEIDPLVDEGLAYADKLRAAGVAVDLEIYRGVTHEFIKMGRALPQARQAHADMGAALRHAFAPVSA